MDSTQHSITNDITAQRQTLATADTAPDREWRENRKASVFAMTGAHGHRCACALCHSSSEGVWRGNPDNDRFTILFTTITAVASITPSGILQVECDRATIDAIVSDFDVVGDQR